MYLLLVNESSEHASAKVVSMVGPYTGIDLQVADKPFKFFFILEHRSAPIRLAKSGG